MTAIFWVIASLYVGVIVLLMVVGAIVHRGSAGPGGHLSETCEQGRHGYCPICGCECHWDER